MSARSGYVANVRISDDPAGILIQSGSRASVFIGYLLGSGLMVIAAIVAAIWGVAAERKPLEEVARPLSSL